MCKVCQFAHPTSVHTEEQCAWAPKAPKVRSRVPVLGKDITELVRADLDQSPFLGEARSKVWARLKYGVGLMVGRKRVLRLIREHNLLAAALTFPTLFLTDYYTTNIRLKSTE